MVTSKPVHIDISLKPGSWIDPAKFVSKIAEAGYQARKDEIRLTVTGKLSRGETGLLFTMDDVGSNPQVFIITAGSSKDAKESKLMADAFKVAGERIGQTVEVEGYWQPPVTKGTKPMIQTIAAFALREATVSPATKP